MGTKNIDDVYELSPLQQGMLLHSLHDGAADMYLSQHTYTVDGPFDLDILVLAWRSMVEAHPSLRTSFHWDGGIEKPLQVVHHEVELPVHRHDWTDRDEERQEKELERLRSEDRSVGFVPAEAPLQRLHLIRRGAQRHTLIWTYHHLLLDGWSVPVFMNELMTHYRSLALGTPPPPPAPPYRSYIAWLQRQNLQEARDFWVRTLADVRPQPAARAGTRGPGARDRRGGAAHRGTAAGGLRGLRDTAARHQVTLSTVVQGPAGRWSCNGSPGRARSPSAVSVPAGPRNCRRWTGSWGRSPTPCRCPSRYPRRAPSAPGCAGCRAGTRRCAGTSTPRSATSGSGAARPAGRSSRACWCWRTTRWPSTPSRARSSPSAPTSSSTRSTSR